MQTFFEYSFTIRIKFRQFGPGSAIICQLGFAGFRYHEVTSFYVEDQIARPAKSGPSNLVKAETANESRGGDQYFSRAVGKALEVLEFLQS